MEKKINPIGLTVCEFYCNNDLCGSHLSRMGGVLTVVDNEEQLELHTALDGLYRFKQVRYYEQLSDDLTYEIVLSNHGKALDKIIETGIHGKWYVVEYVDISDDDIENQIRLQLHQQPEFLMRQLVGSRIYKVVIVGGEG